MSTDFDTALMNILEKIENYATAQTKPGILTSQRMKNAAKKLIKFNPAYSAMTLGMIAAIEGNVGECIKQHALSLKLGKDPILNLNQALSMKTLGHNAEAYRLIEIERDTLMNFYNAIYIYLIIAFNAGQYESIQTCEDMLKIKGATDVPSIFQPYFDDVNTIVNKAPLPFNTYILIASIQEEIRLANDAGYTEYLLEDINGELYYWSLVKAGSEAINLMNVELKAALSKLEYTNLDEFHIAFRAIEPTLNVLK